MKDFQRRIEVGQSARSKTEEEKVESSLYHLITVEVEDQTVSFQGFDV